MEVLKERSIDERYVSTLSTAGPTWTIPFVKNLKRGILPDYHDKAMKIHIKAPSYTLINRELYRKGFTVPWLRCVDNVKGKEALQAAHAGQAGAHEGARPNKEGAPEGNLLAHRVSGCSRANHEMCRVLSICPGSSKTTGTTTI